MKSYKINEITNKRILGRNVQNADKLSALPLFWGGAAFEINVKAKEVWINVSSDYNQHEIFLAVEINGYQITRFVVPKEPTLICIAKNLNPEKENLITLIKDTQPMPGDNQHSLLIHEIALDDDGSFNPLVQRKMKIEFVGDSITSGEGLAGKSDEMDWITPWMCASKTYAVQTAKMLDADWNTMGQCGWGICWGWDANKTSVIPPYYEQVCGILNSDYQKKLGCLENYDFNGGSDFVVINLGTNDNSGFKSDGGKNLDKNEITAEVQRFLKVIRSHNPAAKIIWVWGMLKLDVVPSLIQAGIKDYIKESDDKNVFSLELPSMENEKTEADKGSRGHPGPLTHRMAAEKIVELIKLNKILPQCSRQ